VENNNSRRNFLKSSLFVSAGTLLLPGAFGQQGGQVQTVAKIAQHNPEAIALGVIDSIMGLLPDGALPTWQQTNAAFANFVVAQQQVKATMIGRGLNPEATIEPVPKYVIPMYDFAPLSWNAFIDLEIEALAYIEPEAVPTDVTSALLNGGRVFLAKLAGVLGINDILQAFWAVLDDLAEGLLKKIAEAFKNKQWKLLTQLLGQLFDVITDPDFLYFLGQKVGTEKAKKIIGKILSKALPIVGWAVTIGQLVWAFAEQYLDIMSLEVGETYTPARA
jgi:hypothetical protein